jgi:hypothetical protein
MVNVVNVINVMGYDVMRPLDSRLFVKDMRFMIKIGDNGIRKM